jgi:hypothetical protein
MKSAYQIPAAILLASLWAHAEFKDSINLTDLEIPNSPGFALLDKAPTSIERPSSTKAFMVSVLNALNESSPIPQNYAVDFTPYWFFQHPAMTAYRYAGYDIKNGRQLPFVHILRASVSAAYVTNADSAGILAQSNAVVGLRATIFSVRSKRDIEDLKRANDACIDSLKTQTERLMDYVGDITLSATNPNLYAEKARQFYEHEAEFKNEISQILKRRAVLALDWACAYDRCFANSTFSSSAFGRFGTWLTLNVSKGLGKSAEPTAYLNVYALTKYLRDALPARDGSRTTKDSFDAGGKLEFESQALSIGYEYVYRRGDPTTTFRTNGTVKYQLSDQLFLTAAFGKNFGDTGNLISLLGINWGLSSGREHATIEKL